MSDELFKAILIAVIALLTLWLIYRIQNRIRIMIKDEIFNHFPSVKYAIDSFKDRINYLKTEVADLEHRISEIEKKAK